MRLIDADKLKKYLGSEPLYSDSINEHTYIIEHIDKMPTVDAIPVEWIKRWPEKPMTEKDIKLAEQCKWNIFEWLIADWQRKEE